MFDEETTTTTDHPTMADKMTQLDMRARQQQIADEERRELEAKKNHDFVQFTRKGLMKLCKLKNGVAHQIFHYLSKEMDTENKLIISQNTLAEIFDVSRMSISTAVKELVKAELIDILKVGNANIYCLNAQVVWTQERDKIHLARFNAKVIISKDEQEKFAQVRKTKLKQISLPPTKEEQIATEAKNLEAELPKRTTKEAKKTKV
jgi:hypothetical protein